MSTITFFLLFFLIAVESAKGQQEQIGNGSIRLVQDGIADPSFSSGVVEVYLNNQWGSICKDASFSQTEADIICYQLGYTAASSFDSVDDNTTLDYSDPSMKNLRCSDSNYQVILQCFYDLVRDAECNNDVGVVTVSCYATRIWDNPYSGMVRLSKGRYTSEGLVEVYCNGKWGTVCDDGIDDDESDTICAQLGYTKAFKWDNLKMRGNDTQMIWFDNLFCGHTDKTCIGYCQTCPSSDQNTYCKHYEDMTVQCTYDTSTTSTGTLRTTCKNISVLSGLSTRTIIIIAVSSFVGLIALCFFICLPICCCICLRATKKKTYYAQFDSFN